MQQLSERDLTERLGALKIESERQLTHDAREALRLASHADCQFVWGAAEAGHLLGQALRAQHKIGEARAILDRTLGLRRRLGDPRAADTERLLGQVA